MYSVTHRCYFVTSLTDLDTTVGSTIGSTIISTYILLPLKRNNL